jgi:hypothetical protein
MGYRYDIAIRSTHKYAVRASGDVARVVDLPDGGIALLVIDGQGSGPAARAAARDVAGRLSALLEAGSSAEVAALAANQSLTSSRHGQVSVSFDVVRAGTNGEIDLARYSTSQVLVFDGSRWLVVEGQTGPAGRIATNGPDVRRYSTVDVEAVVVATDGVDSEVLRDALGSIHAGSNPASVCSQVFQDLMNSCSGRPKDDVTLAMVARRTVPADQRFESIDFGRDVR